MVKTIPDYIFESSWEVCNKVGGIYTVLSTHAKTLVDNKKTKLIFIGPDFGNTAMNPLFTEDKELFSVWRKQAVRYDIKVKTGYWNIPGRPIVFLVDFQNCFSLRDYIYARLWEDYKVDSLHAYGDYDEAMMFAYTVGKVVENFYNFNISQTDKVIFHAHEWMTGLAALYLMKKAPQIATVFTTHATTVGRSIAFNGKPLYQYFTDYNGDQMARELNVESKHSVEKQTARLVDCFTTVSELTARECTQLLEREPDALLLNGFENDFVPQGADFEKNRKKARHLRIRVANALLGTHLDDNTLIVGTGGRYEMRNKGIDVFLEALHRLNHDSRLNCDILAFIDVPGWMKGAREDLRNRLSSLGKNADQPLPSPYITHWLNNMEHDQVLETLRYFNLLNAPQERVKVIFAPCYLTGNDGIFNMNYYDMLIGNDLNVYPSYYEPWGYTPLESTAFKVPTLTTTLTGFGLWVNSVVGRNGELTDGVKVIPRTDHNYSEVADTIKESILDFASKSKEEVETIRCNAASIAEKALWKYFIENYYRAYQSALRKAAYRNIH